MNLLLELENYIDKRLRNIFAELKCKHNETYSKSIGKFQFLPGHRALILNLKPSLKQSFFNMSTSTSSNLSTIPTSSSNFGEILSNILDEVRKSPAFSNVLREIIESAINNYAKTPNLYRYSEFIRYFALYLFLLCGRRSYEILSSNLPFPSASTICTYI